MSTTVSMDHSRLMIQTRLKNLSVADESIELPKASDASTTLERGSC